MKKIKCIIGFFILTAFLSCNKDDNTLFDQSPRERLQSKIKEYQNILTSAKDGWITVYRPDDQFGYFNLWFQFNTDGTVHTLSDIPLVNNRIGGSGIFAPQPGFYKDTTTGYRVSSQNSVDLVFENFMALHYLYSLTIEERLAGSPKPEFEFYITRATPEEVVLESKTDSSKGGQQKTQMILKRAAPEDKEKIEKSYAEWDRISKLNTGYTYLLDNLDGSADIDIEKRTIQGEGRFPITEVFPYHIKVKKDKNDEVTYSRVNIGDHPMIVIPKGEVPEVKFAESGRTIDPARITLEGVDVNQVGVYNAVLHIADVALDKKVVVYDPAIEAPQIEVEGEYYIENQHHSQFNGTGTISLVEGTNNIFLASNFAILTADFPVYFQINGRDISLIPQTYVFNNIVNVMLFADPKNAEIYPNIIVFIRRQEDEQEHPDELFYGLWYNISLNNE